MTKYWFKRRRYGYGWMPATREGWLTIFGFILAVFGAAAVMMAVAPDGGFWPVVIYLLVVTSAAGALVWISAKKGPKPRWRWGKKPDDDPDEDF